MSLEEEKKALGVLVNTFMSPIKDFDLIITDPYLKIDWFNPKKDIYGRVTNGFVPN